MARIGLVWSSLIGALCLCLVAVATLPAAAQQPSSVNPMAQSVKEQELLKELQRQTLPCPWPSSLCCQDNNRFRQSLNYH